MNRLKFTWELMNQIMSFIQTGLIKWITWDNSLKRSDSEEWFVHKRNLQQGDLTTYISVNPYYLKKCEPLL